MLLKNLVVTCMSLESLFDLYAIDLNLCVSYAIPYSSLDDVKWRGESTNLPLGGVRLTVTSFFSILYPVRARMGTPETEAKAEQEEGELRRLTSAAAALSARGAAQPPLPPSPPPGVPRRPPPRGRESSPPVSGAGRPHSKSPWRGRGKLDPSASMMPLFFLSPDD
jgi:hypothetical protein